MTYPCCPIAFCFIQWGIMGKRNLFTLTVLLLLFSVTSFSGVKSLHAELVTPLNFGSEAQLQRYWTCYAVDSDDHTFPGLDKNQKQAQKTAVEKCNFFSEASGSCRLSNEDCDTDDL
jgi:hypothetical protein